VRKYFENITGTVTGSDMILKFLPNVGLQYCGFKGEGVVDKTAWIRKTHYPMAFPFMPNFDNDIAVVCTRYQMDIDPSFFNLIFTQSHTCNL